MTVQIRPFIQGDMEEVVRLALLAWAPVFASFRQMLGASVYAVLYLDWERQQREVVERMCNGGGDSATWIAERDGVIAGFLVYTLNHAEHTGVVELLAVHPEHQHRGVATELNRFALGQMKEAGMKVASLGTGGDPGHAPARRAYERAGYKAFPQVWYYQDLQDLD